jgi:hypothetical protein
VGKAAKKRYSRVRKSKACEVCGQRFEMKASKIDNYRTCRRVYCVKRMQSISGKEKWEKWRKEKIERRRARLEHNTIE